MKKLLAILLCCSINGCAHLDEKKGNVIAVVAGLAGGAAYYANSSANERNEFGLYISSIVAFAAFGLAQLVLIPFEAPEDPKKFIDEKVAELGPLPWTLPDAKQKITKNLEYLSKNPRDKDAWIETGKLYLELKRKADAGRCFKWALAIDPADEVAMKLYLDSGD